MYFFPFIYLLNYGWMISINIMQHDAGIQQQPIHGKKNAYHLKANIWTRLFH